MLGAKTREDIGVDGQDVKDIADSATGGIMAWEKEKFDLIYVEDNR